MDNGKSTSARWTDFRPTKTMTVWSCIATAGATMAIGFGAGGWVTGGTAAEMATEAADGARTELVANACVQKFTKSESFAKELTTLKEASSWKQGDLVAAGGWATLAGMGEPHDAAARQCANQLVAMEAPPVASVGPDKAEPSTGS
jgi:hypothetical protein